MRPYVERRAYGADDFFGKKTRRVGALIARAPSTWDICACPLVLQVCSAVLGHQVLHHKTASLTAAPGYKTHPWNLDLTQVIDIEPGESHQTLHRDRWAYIMDFTSIEPRISTKWAIDEFSAENGATRVIPGSHTWPRERFPNRRDRVVQATMPPGSVMIYTGSTWHSGGENKTQKSRYGINVDYSVAWLKQEENQFLSCPPNIAKDLPRGIQELIGYSRSGYALGYVAGGFPPSYSWTSSEPINWATSPGAIKDAATVWQPKLFAKL
jgi:ectoine hydroxylase-related dioxygenase (phytanoyl-CoA dioxygenase family)